MCWCEMAQRSPLLLYIAIQYSIQTTANLILKGKKRKLLKFMFCIIYSLTVL